MTPAGQSLLDGIQEMQVKFPYVSRWYYANKWRGTDLPPDPAVREGMIDELVGAGWLEGYQATDAQGRGTQAVRLVPRDVAAPAGESTPKSFGEGLP